MNSILSTMNSAMNVAVKEFASKISENHPEISVESLMLIWNEMSDSPIKGLKKPKKSKSKSKSNSKRKKSGYITFASEKRDEVAKANEGMKFVEVSKELGKMWQALSEEEKEVYNKKAAEPVDANDFTQLSIAKLKSLCKARGMKGYSQLKKDQLVAVLEGRMKTPERKNKKKVGKVDAPQKSKVRRKVNKVDAVVEQFQNLVEKVEKKTSEEDEDEEVSSEEDVLSEDEEIVED